MSLWPDNKPRHATLFAHLLLTAVILAAYYPALSGVLHTMDDPGIVARYSSSLSLADVIAPGQGYYYRPMLEVTFWLDHLLFGMEPAAMHLENILLHMANAALVFLLARRWCLCAAPVSPALPLCAALVFALHPVNVEAVGWIAGRSDPLLTLFALSACHFWLSWLEGRKGVHLTLAVLFFLAAALTKETALALAPAALVLACGRPHGGLHFSRRQAAGAIYAALLAVAAAGCALLLLRGAENAAARFLAPGQGDVILSLRDLLAAFGFYWKKMLLPLPLDFAITAVSPLYALPGALVLASLALAPLLLRTPASSFFAAAGITILPALVLVLRQISWTPIAERYLYLPTAFFSLGICTLLAGLSQRVLVKAAPFLLVLLLVAAVSVRQRNELWQDKIRFFEDAVANSPRFGALHNELGALYLKEGRTAEASQAFARADRLNLRPSMRLVIKGNIMATSIARGEYEGVRKEFFALFPEKRQAPANFLDMLQAADWKRLNTLPPREKAALAADLIDTSLLLYRRTGEPFWLYQCGKLALITGSQFEAREFFRKAHQQAPADAHYRAAAAKQLQNLENVR